MILADFFVLILALIFSSMALLQLVSKITISPFIEPKLLIISFLSYILAFIFYLLSSYINTLVEITSAGLLSFQFGIFFIFFASALWLDALIFPELKFAYKSLFILVVNNTLLISTGIFNALTINQIIKGSNIVVVFHSFGLLLFILSALIFFLLMTNRIRNLFHLTPNDTTTFLKSKTGRVIFFIPPIITVIVLLITRLELLPLPSFTWCLGFSLFFFGFSIVYSKDKSYFFKSSARLFSISIMNKSNALELFSQEFISLNVEKQQLGPILSSIQSIVGQVISGVSLREITDEDKVIILAEGNHVILYCLLSERFLMAYQLVKTLIHEFERRFSKKLEKNKVILTNLQEFASFQLYLTEIIKFYPI